MFLFVFKLTTTTKITIQIKVVITTPFKYLILIFSLLKSDPKDYRTLLIASIRNTHEIISRNTLIQ